MVRLVDVNKLNGDKKKYVAIFDINGKMKKVKFGASGYSDYTKHHNLDRKRLYILRHSKEKWTDPTKAGTLSRYILWEKTNIVDAINNFKRKFNV